MTPGLVAMRSVSGAPRGGDRSGFGFAANANASGSTRSRRSRIGAFARARGVSFSARGGRVGRVGRGGRGGLVDSSPEDEPPASTKLRASAAAAASASRRIAHRSDAARAETPAVRDGEDSSRVSDARVSRSSANASTVTTRAYPASRAARGVVGTATFASSSSRARSAPTIFPGATCADTFEQRAANLSRRLSCFAFAFVIDSASSRPAE